MRLTSRTKLLTVNLQGQLWCGFTSQIIDYLGDGYLSENYINTESHVMSHSHTSTEVRTVRLCCFTMGKYISLRGLLSLIFEKIMPLILRACSIVLLKVLYRTFSIFPLQVSCMRGNAGLCMNHRMTLWKPSPHFHFRGLHFTGRFCCCCVLSSWWASKWDLNLEENSASFLYGQLVYHSLPH